MSVKRATTIAVLLAMGALLAAGVSVLFDLRFEGGDNYPAYSTLRADPLGARAYYDSLKGIPGLDVTRNLRPLCELKEGAGTTLFYLGVETDGLRWFSGDDSRHLEEFLMDGGRVVLTLAPEVRDPFRGSASKSGSGAFTSSTLAAKSAQCTTSTVAAKTAKPTSATLAKADPKKSDAPTSLPAIYPLPRSIRKAESEEAERQKREEEEKEKRAQAAPT